MRNRLLDALPPDMYRALEGHLAPVSLPRGQVLHSPGEAIQHLYFPLSCLVSITVTMLGGKTAEAGVVGNREVVGINAFMGGSETTQTEYVVQVDGDALKIESRDHDGNCKQAPGSGLDKHPARCRSHLRLRKLAAISLRVLPARQGRIRPPPR